MYNLLSFHLTLVTGVFLEGFGQGRFFLVSKAYRYVLISVWFVEKSLILLEILIPSYEMENSAVKFCFSQTAQGEEVDKDFHLKA